MKGTGRTVFEGTKIEEFGVTILGVLENYDFGMNVITVRIDSGPVVEKGYGVIQGMSGSPIYVQGKLIGAVALVFTDFAKVPIAGVTPIQEMLEAYEPRTRPAHPPRHARRARAPLDWKTPRRFVARGEPLHIAGRTFREAVVAATEEEAVLARQPGDLVLTPVATPLMVTGLGRRGLKYLQELLEPYGFEIQQNVGGGQAPPDTKFELAPGAAVGVQLARGAIDVTALGTLTYLDEETFLAFGHSMIGFGKVDMPLVSATIQTILSSQAISSKMGVPIAPIGRVLEDRNTCVGGHLGEEADLLPATFRVADLDRGIDREYQLEVIRQRNFGSSLLYALLGGAIDMTTVPNREGVTRLRLQVKPEGFPAIERENLYRSGGGFSPFTILLGGLGSSSPSGELARILEALANNEFREVRVESVQAEIEVTEERRLATIERAYADREKVKPGETVEITVHIKPDQRPEKVERFRLPIPEGTPQGQVLVAVAGGSVASLMERRLGRRDRIPANLDQLVEDLGQGPRNDELRLMMGLPTLGLEIEGRRLADLPPVVSEVLISSHARNVMPIRDLVEKVVPREDVLSGGALIRLTMDVEEKDKVPPLRIPRGGEEGEELEPRMSEEAGQILVSGAEPWPLELAAGEPGPAAGAENKEAPAEKGPEKKAEPPKEAELPDVTEELQIDRPPSMPTWEEVENLDLEGQIQVEGEKKEGPKAKKSQGLARAPKVWRHAAEKDFQAGEFEGTYLSSKGLVTLGPAVEALDPPPSAQAWKQVADAAGNVYVGTWADGRIYRLDPDGKMDLYFDSEDLGLQALAVDEAGALYAGGIPSGNVYRLTAANESQVLATLPEPYIWELVWAEGQLYAATGPRGRLYRLTAAGEAEVIFEAPDRHLLALTRGPEKRLYVGTYPRGKVYRIDLAGEKPTPASIFEVPDAAVLSLAVDRAENVFVGCSPKGEVYKVAPSGAGKVVLKTKAQHVFSLVADGEERIYAATGPGGKVYTINPDETTSLLHEVDERYLLHLAWGGAGRFYVTTAGSGKVQRFQVHRPGQGTYLSPILDAGLVAQWGRLGWWADLPPGSQITLQTRSGNTAHPDVAWSDWSSESTAAYGTLVESPPARYLQYRARFFAAPDGSPPALRQVRLFYLPHNQAPVLTLQEPVASQVVSGQFNLRWSAKDPDNDTLTYEVFYSADGGKTWTQLKEEKEQAKEEKPKAEEKETTPSEAPKTGEGEPKDTGANDHDTATEESPTPTEEASEEKKTPAEETGPAVRPQPLAEENRPETLEEPPGEEPVEEMEEEGKEEGEAEGKEAKPPPAAEGPMTKTNFQWDTTKVADGWYRIKVLATDRTSNPRDAETDEEISEPFLVDNTPPVILLNVGEEAIVAPEAVTINDATTRVASGEFRFDEGEWIAAAAADGIFDSPYEDLLIDLSRWPEEKEGEAAATKDHTLEIRVRDAVGNEASVKVKVKRVEAAK